MAERLNVYRFKKKKSRQHWGNRNNGHNDLKVSAHGSEKVEETMGKRYQLGELSSGPVRGQEWVLDRENP